MIKKFICWLWGHKLFQEEKTFGYSIDLSFRQTETKLVRSAYCTRCGAKLQQ